MKCINCNKAVFKDLDLVCRETGEVLVCKNEPMELLLDWSIYCRFCSSGSLHPQELPLQRVTFLNH